MYFEMLGVDIDENDKATVMYSVFQKGQHANLKKNSDYGEQQTDYSVSKCGDRGQTLRWQYSRSTNLSSSSVSGMLDSQLDTLLVD
ncbi:hypothetical protein WN944_002892 [Citrus x changshan-huyou]|uniref:Uncharacterized protein n=1 Tax=Citrus x changshan-huyou TaxID=2935761 RepID=A0AAP0QSL1_9ROSI